MTEKLPKKTAKKATKRAATGNKAAKGFTEDERAAMKERVRELNAAKRGSSKSDDEEVVLAKLAEMPTPDRKIGERIHALIKANAPELAPRTWYGMPAYSRDGEVVCFFQGATKFKTRYCTLGFSDKAKLDDGEMWSTAFAVKKLTAAEEARIVALIKQAVG